MTTSIDTLSGRGGGRTRRGRGAGGGGQTSYCLVVHRYTGIVQRGRIGFMRLDNIADS